MLKVALTGNIGSGKTTVGEIFKILGVPLFNADDVAKSIYSDNRIIEELTKLFGQEIVNLTGEVDKKRLANIIFNDKDALRKINGLIHPIVFNRFEEFCTENSNRDYVIHETAILFENKLESNFDLIINVSANEELRIKRLLKNRSLDKSEIITRIKNQLPDNVKSEMSDYVITNNENEFLIPQVLDVHNQIILLSGNK